MKEYVEKYAKDEVKTKSKAQDNTSKEEEEDVLSVTSQLDDE